MNALREAFATVVARHDALRWRDLDGDRLRVGTAGDDIAFDASELHDVEPALREAALVQHLRAKLDEPFDVASGPLARLVVASAGDEHALMFAAHHLVVDGWSIGVVLRELAELYTARVEGGDAALAPASSFRDFVAWQANRAPERARALAYWRAQLAGLATEPLPTDRPRPGMSATSARTAVVVEGAALRDLRRLARETDVTLVSVLLAGWRIVLGHLLRERRVAIAVPVAGQVAMGETLLVGPCSSVLPAVIALDDGDTAEQVLRSVQKTLADLFQHSDVDLAELPPGEAPAVALLFNHDRVPALPRFGDATIALLPLAPGAGKVELVLNVVELPGRLLVELEFRSDLFERSTAEGWLAAWRACITAMAADPHAAALALPRDSAVFVPERR
ncbi:MAG: condensation domain-containing protein, partial [Candidatus Eremiobacteraeota bacterium]|nr:condensation domain-containing protein [Candidatus Eremiobacteraeota bacterium]